MSGFRHRGLFAGALLLIVGCASPGVRPGPSSSGTVSDRSHETSESQHEAGPGEQAAADTVPSSSSVAPPAGEQEAYERARPVFERYCASCHTSGAGKPAAVAHFAMDRYPFGGHHAGEITSTIREVLGASGQPASMPQDRPGAVQGDELRAILDWADAFDRARAAGHDNEHHHEH
jgi:mono/diheme cytochrome c family protein